MSLLRKCSLSIVLFVGGWAADIHQSVASDDPDAAKTTAVRLYTSEQAKRGARLYTAACAICHREDMAGREPAPELAGETFMSKWSGHSVKELVDRTRTTMPFGKPASLTEQEYWDIVAAVLEANDLAAGATELGGETRGEIR